MNLFSKFLSRKSKQNPKLAESPYTSSSTLELPPDQEAQRQHARPDTGQTVDTLNAIPSHHDMPVPNDDEYSEADAEQYLRFSKARKVVIVVILTYCAFLAPIASTAVLAAVPEVAKTFKTSGDIINASNALYLAFMGLSSTVWGPFSQAWGRRPIFIISAALFFIFSLATALSPNLPAYFVFRILTAFHGTPFLVVGSSAIGDIFEPRSRATALGWILSGSLTGPALGPFLGGVVIQFREWRVIFWLQTALGGFATLAIFCFFPETIPYKTKGDMKGQSFKTKSKNLWYQVSPFRVGILIFSYPNLLLVGLAAGALVWNQYALITPIRYVLNPRFHLHSPIKSSLFYLAPGAGYLAGTLFGGRWADHCVKQWMRRRNGLRIPEDRLRSCLPYICVVIPGFVVLYGWAVDKEVGGIPLPVVAMFIQGVAQLFCFPSLNTYCIDVMHANGRSAEVVAGNYMFRYAFAALGTGVVLPAIQAMGVGWFNTVSAGFLILSGVGVWATALFGPKWREAVDEKQEKKAANRKEVS